MTKRDMFKSPEQFGPEFFKTKPIEPKEPVIIKPNPIEPIYSEEDDSETAKQIDSESLNTEE